MIELEAPEMELHFVTADKGAIAAAWWTFDSEGARLVDIGRA